MANKFVKNCILWLTLFSPVALIAANNSLSFTAAELTGNFTRANLELYHTLSYKNPATCRGLWIEILGQNGTLPLHVPSTIEVGFYSVPTANILFSFDTLLNSFQLGAFTEARNTAGFPIPDCAQDVVFTLSAIHSIN